MISPAYALTATERVLPRLALDFTTGVLDSRVTVTRALNTATRTNSSGAIEIVNANLPRFDYDPVTLVTRGLLIEETRTNLFINSLINGTLLSTQSVTVTAVSHTVSFYGTGTITLSGAATATVVGTGEYPNRQKLTFTPSAGVLICTITGSVQYAQLEVGGFATSFIPSAVTSATRNADNVQMTGTNFSSWYNASEGAFSYEYLRPSQITGGRVFAAGVGGSNSYGIWVNTSNGSNDALTIRDISGDAVGGVNFAVTPNSINKFAVGYKVNSFAWASNGGTTATDASGVVPSLSDQMRIGRAINSDSAYLNSCVRKLFYWPQRIINAEAQAFSK